MPENQPGTTTEPSLNPEPSQPSEPRTTGDEFRYQTGPFAGLTPEQAQTKYDQDTSSLQSQYQNLTNQVTQYVSQIQNQQNHPTTVSDPDLWLTDAARAERELAQRLQQQWSQQASAVAQPLYTGQAQLAKAGSRNDPQFKPVWDKYGKEIETLMAKMPAAHAINKEVWDQAANLIKSNHVDEIAAEKAKELAASFGALERSHSGYEPLPAPTQSAVQKIRESEYGKTHLAEYSDARIIDVAKKMGSTVEDYANMITSTHVISHPKTPGEMTNRELVRR